MKEIRTLDTSFEVREDGDQPIIEGYASTYDTWYNCGWYQERIAKGAFDKCIAGSDVRALINHDPNLIIGRKKANTLMVSTDDHGLRYVINPPDTSYAKDLVVSMKRGDIDQSSFAFTVNSAGEQWEMDSDGVYKRTIKEVSYLYDVSPVTYPANADTNVYARSKDEIEAQLKKPDVDKLIRARAEQEQLEDELMVDGISL